MVILSMRKIVGSEARDFIESSCAKVAVDDSGWETLYRELSSNEYWYLTFPDSEMHGGGEPLLVPISPSKAKEQFGV